MDIRERFFNLKTPRDLVQLLDVPYNRLVWHIYKSPIPRRYATFEIPKKSGGTRRIVAPATALKLIQKKLNNVLQNVYQLKPSVHGFV